MDPAGSQAQRALTLAEQAERYRRELHVHCYRMLASFDEAEDAVQETLLRAWRGSDTFDGTSLRAWLYRIATNVCLDLLRRSSRRLTSLDSMADIAWLQPYPDTLLDEVASSSDEPEAVVVERETIELAFLAALQLLPPRQRAALIVRDVLGWPAIQSATLLDTSVAAANSALQRARATLNAHLPARRAEWSVAEPTDEERQLLAQFIDAHERCDAAAAIAIAAHDIRIAMPPDGISFAGLEVIEPLLERAFGENRDGDWRLVPTRANRMPTAASYLRRPGDSLYRAFKFDVLRVRDGRIVRSPRSARGSSQPSACRRRSDRGQQERGYRRVDSHGSPNTLSFRSPHPGIWPSRPASHQMARPSGRGDRICHRLREESHRRAKPYFVPPFVVGDNGMLYAQNVPAAMLVVDDERALVSTMEWSNASPCGWSASGRRCNSP